MKPVTKKTARIWKEIEKRGRKYWAFYLYNNLGEFRIATSTKRAKFLVTQGFDQFTKP